MATTPWDAFNEFKRRLLLTDNQREALNARRDATIGYVEAAFLSSSDLPVKEARLIGSAGRNTIIRPLDDIDLMVIFTNKANIFEQYRNDSRAFLYRIRDALKRSSTVQIVGARGQAVRFFYKDPPHVDVTPMFKWKEAGFALPAGDGNWITTDPDFHDDYFGKRDAQMQFHLKPMVRMLKRWNTEHSAHLRSFHLETMVSDVFSGIGTNSREACERFFEWAPNHIDVKDPAGHSGALSGYLTSGTRRAVVSSLQVAEERAHKANQAENRGNHAEAIRLWRILFGDEFPAYG